MDARVPRLLLSSAENAWGKCWCSPRRLSSPITPPPRKSVAGSFPCQPMSFQRSLGPPSLGRSRGNAAVHNRARAARCSGLSPSNMTADRATSPRSLPAARAPSTSGLPPRPLSLPPKPPPPRLTTTALTFVTASRILRHPATSALRSAAHTCCSRCELSASPPACSSPACSSPASSGARSAAPSPLAAPLGIHPSLSQWLPPPLPRLRLSPPSPIAAPRHPPRRAACARALAPAPGPPHPPTAAARSSSAACARPFGGKDRPSEEGPRMFEKTKRFDLKLTREVV